MEATAKTSRYAQAIPGHESCEHCSNVPQQADSTSCGFFVCWYALHAKDWVSEIPSRWLHDVPSQEWLRDQRLHLVASRRQRSHATEASTEPINLVSDDSESESEHGSEGRRKCRRL